MTKTCLTIMTAGVLAALAPACLAELDLAAGFVSPAQLHAAHGRLVKKDPVTVAAFEMLIEKADAALAHQPQAMADFAVPAFYGPQREQHRAMKRVLSADSSAAFHLALAAAMLDPDDPRRAKYAGHATTILHDWATKNEKASDFDGDLVMCYDGTAFVFAASLIDMTDAWPDGQRQAFAKWIERVLLDSASIKKRKNNWACWGIMASLAGNRFLARDKAVAKDIDRLRQIIDQQIADDGAMPHEIKRGERGVWYTYFALAPMTAAIQIARNASGPDLFLYQPESGGTVKEAVTFFYQRGLKDQSRWPRQVDDELDPAGKHGALMYAMGCVYDVAEWRDFAKHPTWRDSGGLAWICPSLLPPAPGTPSD